RPSHVRRDRRHWFVPQRSRPGARHGSEPEEVQGGARTHPVTGGRSRTRSGAEETRERFLGLADDAIYELLHGGQVVDDADDLAARHDAGGGIALHHGAAQKDRGVRCHEDLQPREALAPPHGDALLDDPAPRRSSEAAELEGAANGLRERTEASAAFELL